MSKAKQKGNELEHAVHKIEETLLASYPSLAGADATLERNRIFTIDGVRHEVDIWITISPGTPYETHHLVECKNHKKAVGTDEVDKLVAKRNRLGAHKALIVARSFTRDAVAVAKAERIELAEVSDDFWPPLDAFRSSVVGYQREATWFTVCAVDQTSISRMGNLDHQTPIIVNRSPATIATYIEPALNRHLTDLANRDARARLEGLHRGRTGFTVFFGSGEATIHGEEVTRIVVEYDYILDVVHGKISARFNVKGRGGFVRMDYPPGTTGLKAPSTEYAIAVSGVSLDSPEANRRSPRRFADPN